MEEMSFIYKKICCTCKTNKHISFFFKDRSSKDGYAHKCKICASNFKKLWQQKNKDKMLIYGRLRYIKHRARYCAYVRRWNRNNPEKKSLQSRNRFYNVKRAIPKWADFSLIKDIYLEANYFGLQVDHIIPITHKNVCGLHWEGNLQLLTKSENSKKRNSYHP